MTTAERAPLGGFSHVDADPGAAALIAALDEQASLPAIQRLRASAHGQVVGVEPSATMLDEARRRTGNSTLPVEFRAGDISRLDFGDATFDGVTCERVLQHLDAPATAIGERVRVTRPGGRIVVIDTDWGMHAIHGADPDVTASIIACWSANAANGWSGRQLPALFSHAGISDPIVVAETFTTTDPRRPTTAPFTTMADAAATAGVITGAQGRSWLADLADAGTTGSFFWAVTMFAVGGVRHPPNGTTRAAKEEDR